MNQPVGNVLGNPRAEADTLLDRTFLETADFRALVETTDFHVVVGRRGTGKSALYHKVWEHFQGDSRVILHREAVREHHAISMHALVARHAPSYRAAHAISRVIWKAYLVSRVARKLADHYKARGKEVSRELQELLEEEQPSTTAYSFGVSLLERCDPSLPQSLAAQLASMARLDALQEATTDYLKEKGMRALVLLDSLDEGWEPDEISTALIGGLVRAAADLRDAESCVHTVAFLRDNLFRALSFLDPDFSRHIEGSDLRLRWDPESLLRFAAQRIRVAFHVEAENATKVWNRFTARGLQEREGFLKCLQNTLYRPRDLLVLLNRGYQIAARAGRQQVIDDDVDTAAVSISEERLRDLLKEYDQVLPGLGLFVDLFKGTKAVWPLAELIQFLDSSVAAQTYEVPAARDFAILNSGREVLLAMYGVGFFGLQRTRGGPYVFCHDGANADFQDIPGDANASVHPCYWRALGIDEESLHVDVLTHVHDEYTVTKDTSILDQRVRRLGQIVEELPRLEVGAQHARAFETWVERAVKIAFAGDLGNVQLHPNPSGVQRRDLVATIEAESGFWRRVREDYGTRQVIFEVKNYADLQPDDYRQALSYSGKEYGKLVFIVYRPLEELANENERSHLQEMYTQHGLVVVLLPALLLSRFMSKMRSGVRRDYWQKKLSRLLDTHLRSYLATNAGRGRSRSRKRRAYKS